MSRHLPRSLEDLPLQHRIGVLKQLGTGGVKPREAVRLEAVERPDVAGQPPGPSLSSRHSARLSISTDEAKLNKTEQRCRDLLLERGYYPILEQAITLRLDPPFTSYRPDLVYVKGTHLTLVEVKGPHRFREKGIAKAALAAKTYPMFRFELFDWTNKGWKESVLSP